ncbi:hypothetical protein BXY85_1608 [Roseivirga pacifica]|uniref:Tetratricopeptide repeat-containing protein n=1 Tax=Roseivirga pacifica TaxID=1267423 RepID=A0A1I0MPM6_9BACT|nr:hypothetical protein [Roseivirga pacifica]RKQ50592.1 hypothetical protein BXY85_1608 [Roseivirga pacifica]SEV90473.1 hypothetical protein SAMN05216290_0592 [Roseivirga pacifica]
MKKLIIILGLIVAGFSLKAQNQQAYINAMVKGLQTLGAAQSIEDLQSAAGQFERIAGVAKDDWYAPYYAALSYTRIGLMADGISTKDEYIQQAKQHVDKALELQPKNSEVKALEGFVYLAQLAADPNTRGQMLSPKVMQTLNEALAMDKENPRAMVLLAQMQYGMAEFFGSPVENACALAKKSEPLFEAEKQGQSFDPTWGVDVAKEMAQKCNN